MGRSIPEGVPFARDTAPVQRRGMPVWPSRGRPISGASEHEQVVREDGLPDGRDEVFPALVEATGQAEHPLEKRDAPFHARSERLRVAEEGILLSLGLGRRHTPQELLIRPFQRSGPPPLLRGMARDRQRLPLGAAEMKSPRADGLGVDLARALDQARQHPVAVSEHATRGPVLNS